MKIKTAPFDIVLSKREKQKVIDYVKDNPCTAREIYAMLTDSDEFTISQGRSIRFRNRVLENMVRAGQLRSKVILTSTVVFWSTGDSK